MSFPDNSLKLWDITFNSPLFNAAGMFKTGHGYNTVARMGLGAYLLGTTTASVRRGNQRYHVWHPFVPYSHSGVASNWMGLPNNSHYETAKVVSRIEKVPGCPIGASLAEDPETIDEFAKVIELSEGMLAYERAGVDFIELNFGCPNVIRNVATRELPIKVKKYGRLDELTITKMALISERFLSKRQRFVPVIAKYSNDIEDIDIPDVIDLLSDLKFDGINIGNTSTLYHHYEPFIHPKDLSAYRYFTSKWGGGLSGSVLRENSLSKCRLAAKYVRSKLLGREFHVVRAGGVSSPADIKASKDNDIPLNQWFTGFFEAFSRDGFKLMQNMDVNG